MTQPAGRHVSPWVDTMPTASPVAAAFPQDAAEVVVVGGGITGLTTALLLQEAGRRVVVVEGRRIQDSVTTHSTVKVTVGHGTAYTKIARSRGEDAARVYADANTAGFEQVLHLVRAHGIECMLEHGHPHVVYAERPEEVQQVEQEAHLAQRLGLPVTLTDTAPLPFPVAAAASFEQQAHFHPGRYLDGLARAFGKAGGTLLEDVWARGVDEDGDGCEVETTAGPLRAEWVVVATHYPFLNRGGQFTRLTARRSYGVAGVLPDGVPAGMTINVGSPTHSTRTAHLADEELLVVVGEGHEVGHVSETAQRWVRLQEWARDRFGVREFRYHWSAQEVSSLDSLPFVGRLAPGSRRILTATAFDGWGMTNGTMAAMLLRDLVLGEDNEWASTFDARRAETTPPPLSEFAKQNLHVARTWLKDRLVGSPPGDPADLQPGEAAVVEVDGEQTAAYRDEQGGLHAVSAVCTHLKCTVAWNGGEKSWDGPCHGSRFSPDGDVLHGPASTPLEPRSTGSA